MDEEGLEFFEGLKATIWPKSITFRTLDKVAEKRKLMDQGIKKIKVSHGFTVHQKTLGHLFIINCYNAHWAKYDENVPQP